MTVQYRKGKAGGWVLFGPAAELHSGVVSVTTRGGTTKQERVSRVSRPFDVDGVPHVYGYIAEAPRPTGPVPPGMRGIGYKK